MTDWFLAQNHVLQALIAGIFTWFVTAAGSFCALFLKHINNSINNLMLGFASGVMVAASFWSLLSPAIVVAELLDYSIIVIVFGFLSGGVCIAFLNYWIPHIHIMPRDPEDSNTMEQTGLKRGMLLFLAMTLHNIPEGLAIGVAFGAVYHGLEGATIGAAIALALGIGIQNFPEGFAISMPLRTANVSRRKSFFYGQISAIVEPISTVIGAAVVVFSQSILPFALSFAAGAMIFVVIEELVPAAIDYKNKSTSREKKITKIVSIAALGFMIGFSIMMTLDVVLG